jgi:transposase
MAHDDRADGIRVLIPQRNQIELRAHDLESTMATDHRVRSIWAFVSRLDLSQFYGAIKARGSDPGRSATDPRILLTLWLYATSEGIGSARQVDRLCKRDDAYRWICGGVPVNYHKLSDFRVDHGEKLDDLMTQVLAVLLREGIIKLRQVAQDGMRVRASAGASSFRREKSLHACLEKARQRVEELRREIAEDPAAHVSRQQAAEERAAREREEAINRALVELPKVQGAKKRARESGKKKVGEARVSTTDPEARVMKMGDGGFRPAYNVQLATDVESRVIVGVGVINNGSDKRQVGPILDDIQRRTGILPREHLADAGFNDRAGIDAAAERGVTMYTPPVKAKPRADGQKSHHKPESAVVQAWRARMETEEAKKLYRQRAATAETVNADLRCWRGLDRLRVRGQSKVLTVTLWAALTYNIMQWIKAGPVIAA